MNGTVPARLVRTLQLLGRERRIVCISARQHAVQLTDAPSERVHLRGEQRVRRVGRRAALRGKDRRREALQVIERVGPDIALVADSSEHRRQHSALAGAMRYVRDAARQLARSIDSRRASGSSSSRRQDSGRLQRVDKP